MSKNVDAFLRKDMEDDDALDIMLGEDEDDALLLVASLDEQSLFGYDEHLTYTLKEVEEA